MLFQNTAMSFKQRLRWDTEVDRRLMDHWDKGFSDMGLTFSLLDSVDVDPQRSTIDVTFSVEGASFVKKIVICGVPPCWVKFVICGDFDDDFNRLETTSSGYESPSSSSFADFLRLHY